MNKLVLFMVAALAATSLMAKQVYKSQDALGRTIYSDQPAEGAEKINLHDVQTYKAPPVPQAEKKQESNDKKPAEITYQLEFAQPHADQVYTHNVKDINVQLSANPTLAPHLTYELYLDGKLHGQANRSGNFVLKDLARGAHSLKGQVVNKNTGKVVSQTGTLTIHQKRPIVKPKTN